MKNILIAAGGGGGGNASNAGSNAARLSEELRSGLSKMGHNALDDTAPADTASPEKTNSLDMAVWIQSLPQDPTPLADLAEEEWIASCEAEIKSAADTAAKYYEPLKAGKGRLIFIIPSISMGGAEGFAASSGAGEAIRILAKSLAKDWGRDSVLVHALALNPSHFLDPELGRELSRSMSLSDPALGGGGDAQKDIAGILDLLTRDGADFWTGATINLDGGIWMAQ